MRGRVIVVLVAIKRIEQPVFNQVAAGGAVRAVKRTHVLYGACQARCRFNARGVNRQLDGKQFVRPPAALEDLFATDERALFQSQGHTRAVPAGQVQLFPEFGLQNAVLPVADYRAKNFAGEIFNLSFA